MTFGIRTKGKCKICRTPYEKKRAMQKVPDDHIDCAIELGRRQKAKLDRVDTRRRKEAIKTRSDRIKECQVAFNRLVRMRDLGLPCASCGSMPEQKYGGTMDCSHYRSVGSSPHLRFNLFNAASACVKCNRYLGGNVASLRQGLITKFGLSIVERIEADNSPKKYSEAWLIRAKRIFTKRAKMLADRRNCN